MAIRLELQDTAFRHGRSADWVFREVDLHLQPGVYGLFGPNGSGKSTLLQCMAGIYKWSRGEDRWLLGGRPLYGKERLERIGYVPQEPAFYEEMKAEDFLCYVARMKLIPGQLIPERVAEMLALLHLVPFARVRIDALSAGQRKRLSIAQALLNDPHLLLLDEALEGLDMEERAAVLELLQELADGCIIVLAGHLLTEIEPWLHQVMFMANGRVLGPKTPEQWKWLFGHGSDIRPTLDDVYAAAVSS